MTRIALGAVSSLNNFQIKKQKSSENYIDKSNGMWYYAYNRRMK